MQKIQGFTEAGNTQLIITGAAGTIARKVQGSFPGATITVYFNSSYSSSVAIASISRVSNIVTVTVAAGSGLIAGELVTIAGVTNATFNGTFTIFSTTGTTFTYVQAGINASSSEGSAQSALRLASIYSDDGSPPTAKANPFTSSAEGTWFFYAPDGRYDVRFNGGGISVPFTLGDIQAFDVTRPANIRIGCQFPGVDMSEQINAAIADLPDTGGVVDARCFEGDQTFSSDVTLGASTKPVTLLLNPGVTITMNDATLILQNGSTVVGNAMGRVVGECTTFKRVTGTTPMVTATGIEGNHVRGFSMQGLYFDGGSTAGHGIVLSFCDTFILQNVECRHGGASNALRMLDNCWDFSIMNCSFVVWGNTSNYTVHMAGTNGSIQITDGHWFGTNIGELTTGAPLLFANAFVLQQRFVDCKFHTSGGAMTHLVDWSGYRSDFIGSTFQADTASASDGMIRMKNADNRIIGGGFNDVGTGDAIKLIGPAGSLIVLGVTFRGAASPSPGSAVVTDATAAGKLIVESNEIINLTNGYNFATGSAKVSVGPTMFSGVTNEVITTGPGIEWQTYNIGRSKVTMEGENPNADRSLADSNNPVLSIGGNVVTNVSGYQGITLKSLFLGAGRINETIGIGQAREKLSGFGNVDGASIQHPIAFGYIGDTSIFGWYAKTPGAALTSADLRARLTPNGIFIPNSLGSSTKDVVLTPYQVLATDGTILIDATVGAFLVGLLAASSVPNQILCFKKVDVTANVITIDADGADTIDGGPSYSLVAQNDSVIIQSNGVNWFVLGRVN